MYKFFSLSFCRKFMLDILTFTRTPNDGATTAFFATVPLLYTQIRCFSLVINTKMSSCTLFKLMVKILLEFCSSSPSISTNLYYTHPCNYYGLQLFTTNTFFLHARHTMQTNSWITEFAHFRYLLIHCITYY